MPRFAPVIKTVLFSIFMSFPSLIALFICKYGCGTRKDTSTVVDFGSGFSGRWNGQGDWSQLRANRLGSTTKPCSFAKFAENGIVVFSLRMAFGTGGLSCSRQLPIDLIVSRKTHEFPPCSRGMKLALLNHDIHATRLALDDIAGDLLGFE